MDSDRGNWYSNRVSRYSLQQHVYTIENNLGGGYSRYRVDTYAKSHVGYGSWTSDAKRWNSACAGSFVSGNAALRFDIGGDFAGKTILLNTYDTGPVYHASDGTLGFTAGANHGVTNPPGALPTFGSADIPTVWLTGDRLARVPDSPWAPTPSEIAPTSMRLTWNMPYNGGSPIDQFVIHWSTDPNFATYDEVALGGDVTSHVVGGLTPTAPYRWRVLARNGVGYSAPSSVTAQATLPSSPPGISPVPSLSGRSATVTMSPPGGVSGVNSYDVQYRVGSAGTATSLNTTSATITVNGLTQDVTYQWRARARIGTYLSPYSDWVAVPQPSPNVYPGKFYDGSTASTADIDYIWDGAAENTASRGMAPQPRGWLPFADGNPTAGATGTVYRVTGGFDGRPHAAKVVFFSDQTVPGFSGGTAVAIPVAADVAQGGYYTGFLSIQPSRANRVRARLLWLSAAGAVLGASEGTPVVAPANQRTVLTAQGLAPANAEYAAVLWITEAGTGYTNWLGGDSVIEGNAQMTLGSNPIPFFDGNSPSVPGFEYVWEDVTYNSASIRFTVPIDETDALADPDCPPLPPPPLPPVIPSDCIVEIGTWRRYALTIPAVEVPEWSETIPTLVIRTGASAERQVRIRFFENPEDVNATLIDDTAWVAELILTYIPANTTMTLDGISERVRAEVDGRATVPADHLLYGTGGGPASWPVLSCGISYVVAFDAPLEAPPGNLTITPMLTGRMS